MWSPPTTATSRRQFLQGVSASLAAVAVGLPVLASRQAIAQGGVTKIAPTEAEQGEPFTLIDTELGRLADGSVALFVPVFGGTTVEISLRTHKPFRTAQGRLPLSIPGGDYDVFVRQPNENLIPFGPFHVIGRGPAEPTITPTAGPPGTAFTIMDPLGRMNSGDLAVFYPEGTDPAQGTPATNVQVSADHTTLTGTVPLSLAQNAQHFVSVRATLDAHSRFGDLPFFVQATAPSIQPTQGSVGTPFTIFDPQGRMTNADRIIFTVPGADPSQGTVVVSPTFSADGTTASGTVPVTPEFGLHNVSVHAGDPQFNPPLFAAVAFAVTLG